MVRAGCPGSISVSSQGSSPKTSSVSLILRPTSKSRSVAISLTTVPVLMVTSDVIGTNIKYLVGCYDDDVDFKRHTRSLQGGSKLFEGSIAPTPGEWAREYLEFKYSVRNCQIPAGAINRKPS